MTDRPYTDDDLRQEAARQLAIAGEDPDFMGIGERMSGRPIPSTVVDLEPETGEPLEMSRAWSQLSTEDFTAAQHAIDDLIAGAADVSEWAVNLGADGLQPYDGSLTLSADTDKPIVRVHVAFDSDMPDEMRVAFLEGLGQQIASFL
ncbi:hypothetical protein PV350_45955 [Streptomyces sp. PA03-6a]|nr:hypothetical protein [Streptomyces sp. PA03-6a]